MNNQEHSYIITVKVILVILLVVVALGLVTGVISARLETQSFLRRNPQGTSVIQTIQTQSQVASSFSGVIDERKGGVVGVLDESKSVIRIGTILTADGVFITPSTSDQKETLSVIMADGKIDSAILVREYPEKGVSFYRVRSSFSAPQFLASEVISPGDEGIFIGLTDNNPRLAIFPGMIQRISTEENMDGVVFRERQAKLVFRPGNEFFGAPFFDKQNNLLGIVVNAEQSLLLPISEINFLLQDYLKHGAESVVTLFNGLSGSWVMRENSDGKMGASFKINSIEKNSLFAKAGLTNNDIIYSINDINFPDIQLWGAFLESARSSKTVTLGIARKNEILKIPVTIIIQNATQQ
jgi:hypothetical protein